MTVYCLTLCIPVHVRLEPKNLIPKFSRSLLPAYSLVSEAADRKESKVVTGSSLCCNASRLVARQRLLLISEMLLSKLCVLVSRHFLEDCMIHPESLGCFSVD